jgi:lipopolysaccharide transport system permease protein
MILFIMRLIEYEDQFYFIMKTNNIFFNLKRLYRYKGRLYEGVYHDVNQRYAGSAFGMLWAIAFPLMQLTIYAVLYAVIFKIRPSGLTEMGYVLLVFSGLVPLLIYNEALSAGTGSLSANKTLLLNTVFPAELIPVRAALAAQVPSLIGLLITVILGYVIGSTSYQALIFVPILWILLIMFTLGLVWILSLFSLVARDIQHIMILVTMILIFMSPFAYTPEMVPSGLKIVIYFNPLSYFVMPFQQVIAYGTWPDPIMFMGTLFISITTFFTGLNIFLKSKNVFFDYA